MFAIPDPLHPAIVHLPIALALLAPFVALLGAFAIAREWLPARVWIGVVLMQALLAGSAWVAEETGHEQEERVEKIVAKEEIHEHEEAGERLVVLSFISLVVSAVGLLSGSKGGYGRAASVVMGVVLLGAAAATGHSGGALVYEHGAAQAYVKGSAAATTPASSPAPAQAEDGTD